MYIRIHTLSFIHTYIIFHYLENNQSQQQQPAQQQQPFQQPAPPAPVETPDPVLSYTPLWPSFMHRMSSSLSGMLVVIHFMCFCTYAYMYVYTDYSINYQCIFEVFRSSTVHYVYIHICIIIHIFIHRNYRC